jgi:excisionase family DNA binding protein
MEKFYKVKEFAEILRVHPHTILKMIKEKKLHPVNVGSEKRPTYILPEDDILRLRAQGFIKDE